MMLISVLYQNASTSQILEPIPQGLNSIFNEIDALFLELNQRAATDCHHRVCSFCPPNCCRNNFAYKLCKSNANQMLHFDLIEEIMTSYDKIHIVFLFL